MEHYDLLVPVTRLCTAKEPASNGTPARFRFGSQVPAGTLDGSGTILMYGLGSSHSPKSSFASSFETEPAMITSSPGCHCAGVDTLWFAVSWSESMTRSTSSKLRPVVIG